MRILIAGIGNIFHGDDAFGVEVVTQLMRQPIREGVRVADFGIRSYDLMFTLEDAWDAVILVDAMSRGEAPGTVSLLKPGALNDVQRVADLPDAHSLNPVRVLEMIQSRGISLPKCYVIGCEPEMLDAEDFMISDTVRDAIPQAITMIHRLVDDLLRDQIGAGRARISTNQSTT